MEINDLIKRLHDSFGLVVMLNNTRLMSHYIQQWSHGGRSHRARGRLPPEQKSFNAYYMLSEKIISCRQRSLGYWHFSLSKGKYKEDSPPPRLTLWIRPCYSAIPPSCNLCIRNGYLVCIKTVRIIHADYYSSHLSTEPSFSCRFYLFSATINQFVTSCDAISVFDSLTSDCQRQPNQSARTC